MGQALRDQRGGSPSGQVMGRVGLAMIAPRPKGYCRVGRKGRMARLQTHGSETARKRGANGDQ